MAALITVGRIEALGSAANGMEKEFHSSYLLALVCLTQSGKNNSIHSPAIIELGLPMNALL
jgi:hypothetical protein